MKTYISVPQEQSHRAKALGARFDIGKKSWFVPDGIDLWLFREWLPKEVVDYWARAESMRRQRRRR